MINESLKRLLFEKIILDELFLKHLNFNNFEARVSQPDLMRKKNNNFEVVDFI